MIFGFGAGKIDISLEKFNFLPGETIKGRVSFELKKPTLAKKLRVTLNGVRITTYLEKRLNRPPTRQTRKDFIHRFELVLDGEKEYLKGEYPFEIKIPANVLTMPSKPTEATEGVLGTMFKTFEMLKAKSSISRIEWYLEAAIELPAAFDIKKRVDITVG